MMTKSAKATLSSWDTIIKATEQTIADLTLKIYSDPQNAPEHRANIMILILHKQEALIRKKLGEEKVRQETFQELLDELKENAKHLASDIEWNSVYPSKVNANKVVSRIHHIRESLAVIEQSIAKEHPSGI